MKRKGGGGGGWEVETVNRNPSEADTVGGKESFGSHLEQLFDEEQNKRFNSTAVKPKTFLGALRNEKGKGSNRVMLEACHDITSQLQTAEMEEEAVLPPIDYS